MLVSCSRDKTLLKWDLLRQQGEDYGRPRLLMRGHSNFVQVWRRGRVGGGGGGDDDDDDDDSNDDDNASPAICHACPGRCRVF